MVFKKFVITNARRTTVYIKVGKIIAVAEEDENTTIITCVDDLVYYVEGNISTIMETIHEPQTT